MGNGRRLSKGGGGGSDHNGTYVWGKKLVWT